MKDVEKAIAAGIDCAVREGKDFAERLDGGPGSGNFGHPGYPRGGHSAQNNKAQVRKMNKEREEWSNLSLRQKIKGNSEQQKHMAKVKLSAVKAALQGNQKKANAIRRANAHYWGNDPESAMKIQSETLARQKKVK